MKWNQINIYWQIILLIWKNRIERVVCLSNVHPPIHLSDPSIRACVRACMWEFSVINHMFIYCTYHTYFCYPFHIVINVFSIVQTHLSYLTNRSVSFSFSSSVFVYFDFQFVIFNLELSNWFFWFCFVLLQFIWFSFIYESIKKARKK